jgi:hypothetical protein
MEELHYNLLYRWFVGLGMDDVVWTPTTFTNNRQRLPDGEIAAASLEALVQRRARRAICPTSTPPSMARCSRSGPGRTVSCAGISARRSRRTIPAIRRSTSTATGGATPRTPRPPIPMRSCTEVERPAESLGVLGPRADRQPTRPDREPLRDGGDRDRRSRGRADPAGGQRVAGSTVGVDNAYDVATFVAGVRDLDVTPHVGQRVRGSAIDGRTTRHTRYAISQQKRKLVEQVRGWMKTLDGLRKPPDRGGPLVDWILTFAGAIVNLVRMRTLQATCA